MKGTAARLGILAALAGGFGAGFALDDAPGVRTRRSPNFKTWQEQFEADGRAVGRVRMVVSCWQPKRQRCPRLLRNKRRAKLLAWKGR